jgi:hypothetical protein
LKETTMPGSDTLYTPPGDEDDADDMSIDTAGEDDGEGLEVNVIDDTPAEDRGRKPLAKPVEDPTEEELAEYGARSKKRISELTHARHDERRRADLTARERDEAVAVAKNLKAENDRLRGVVSSGTKVVIESSVKLAESQVEDAKRKLREATDSFDNEAIVSAQDALFEARIKLDRVKNTPVTPLQDAPAVVKSANPQANAEPVDQKSLRWQQKNQWFGSAGYEDVTSYALGLDVKLRNQGVDPRSDEYFQKVDASLKATFPKMFASEEGGAQTRNAPRPSAVAATSRSVGTRKVTLTQTQVALAKRLGLTPQQYAAEVVKLENS